MQLLLSQQPYFEEFFKILANPQVWGRVVDNHRPIYDSFTKSEKAKFADSMGPLKTFNCSNPSGRYLFSLAIASEYRIATYLLEQYKAQKEAGHSTWPLKVRHVDWPGAFLSAALARPLSRELMHEDGIMLHLPVLYD